MNNINRGGFKKILLIGIAGTTKDFLLSLPALKSFVLQDRDIKENSEIILKQYPIDEKIEKIIDDINKIYPDLLGFSSYTWNIDSIFEILKELKNFKNNDKMKIVLGGPEITKGGILKGRFNNLNIDFLIFGEGEKPFFNLLKKNINVKGIAYKTKNGFSCSENFDVVENLESIPSAYLLGYVSKEIFLRPGIRANIETQRGCNFRCAYCFYHKNFPKIRYRNPEDVIKEIEYVYDKGVKEIRITDANFLSNPYFAKKILKGMINNKIKMSVFLEIHPMFMNEEISELFKEYINISQKNRIVVGVGIQTINQEALAVVRRKIPTRFFENAFDLLQKAGVIIKSDIIFGLPRETLRTYYETLEYIAEKMRYKKNFLTLALLRILPGTELAEIAEKEGFKIDERDGSHYIYSTPTIPREEIIEGLRMNTVACRLLSTEDKENRMKIRDLYFKVKDSLRISHIMIFKYFIKEFFNLLKNKNADYVKEDFPNPEDYFFKKVYEDIPDEWLIGKLNEFKGRGILLETVKTKKKFNVLITASGTVSAQCVIKGFKQQDEFEVRIITADMDENNAGRYLSDKFYKVPAVKDENYLKCLLEICEKEKVNVLIPILDKELLEISENSKEFEKIGCFPIVSKPETIRNCNNKYEAYRFFKDIGIKTPKIYDIKDRFDFPVFIKPSEGAATENCIKIGNNEELEYWLKRIERPIIQEFIEGKEYSVDILSDLNGNVIEVIPRTRDATRHGASVKGKTIKDEEIIEKAKYIAEKLNVIGPCNIQCFKKNNGEIFFFEINPRFGGTYIHSIASGLNSPHLLLKMLDKQEIKPRIGEFKENLRMVRYFNEIFIDEKEDEVIKNERKNKNIGIVFDFDGVLSDYSYRYHKTYEDVLKKFNIKCPNRKEIYNLRRNFCFSQEEMLNKFLVPQEEENREEIITKCVKERNRIIEDEEYLKYDKFFDGVFEIIKELKEKGYIIGLITKRKNKENFLKQLRGNSDLFDYILVNESKNDSLVEFLTKFNIKDCYFLSDYSGDILQGKKANVKTVGVLSGIENLKNLLKVNPDFIIESIKEIDKIIRV